MGADTNGEDNFQKVKEFMGSLAPKLYEQGVRATRSKEGCHVFKMPNGELHLCQSKELWDDLFKVQGEKTRERLSMSCSDEVEDFPAPDCTHMPNVHGLGPDQIRMLEANPAYQELVEYSKAVVELAVAAKDIVTFADETPLCLPSAVFGLCAKLADALKKYDATVLSMGEKLGM